MLFTFHLTFKSYYRYKTIASQDVSSEVETLDILEICKFLYF